MHFHIDTDMGVDDSLALVIADKVLGNIAAVSTVFGNIPVEFATRNALIFRELLQSKRWDVFQGASKATDGFSCNALNAHGDDGLGGAIGILESSLLQCISKQTVAALGEAKRPSPGPLTIIGLGPATNIPSLVSWYGRSAISSIVLMTGAFFDVGNITLFAEFNAFCDPTALQTTLNLGIPVTIVPLDVCRKILLPRNVIAAYESSDPSTITNLIVRSHMQYMDFYQSAEGIDGCFPHDSIAVLVALAPEHFFYVAGRVHVESTGPHRGRTSIEVTNSHIKIVTGGKLKWVRNFFTLSPMVRSLEASKR
jgi:purine nucleosidase